MELAIMQFFQSFREGAGSFLYGFLYQLTVLGDKNVIPLFLASVYWVVSKEFGTYLLFGYQWNRLFNGWAKVTACVYRPWIKYPSIKPDAASLPGATGYSFPSGHSMNAATFFGGIGISNKVGKPMRVASFLIMLLIGFSRVYMCVHTLQDILVGFVVGCLVMLVVSKLLPKIEKSTYGDLVTAGISIAVSVLIALYAYYKKYPVDYDANGKILVDGAKMATDTYKAVGWNLGFFIGWILERRFVKFNTEVTIENRCLRLLCGIPLYYFFNNSLVPILTKAIGGGIQGTIISCILQMLFITFLYPVCIKLFQNKGYHKA